MLAIILDVRTLTYGWISTVGRGRKVTLDIAMKVDDKRKWNKKLARGKESRTIFSSLTKKNGKRKNRKFEKKKQIYKKKTNFFLNCLGRKKN